MNKQFLFISVASLILSFGCAKEPEPKAAKPAVKVGVSLAGVRTKTWLDPNADESGKRPVYWSEGDIINVNGFQSMPLTADQAGKQTADFFFYSGKAPYSVIYPASVCADGTYGEDGTIMVSIPSVQEYSATSFGNGSAILYGYGQEQPVALRNLCGAVRVTLQDAGTKIVNATLISNGSADAVAGTFRLDPQTGECTAVSGIGSISLDIEEVALDDEGQSFYFAVPEGLYADGFTFRFYDAAGGAMECRWLDNSREEGSGGITVEGGKLYEFKPVGFEAGGMTVLSENDWIYIAGQINSGSDSWKKLYLNEETNTVKLGADIVLSDDVPAISVFSAVLDGCGHTITRQGGVKPLVKSLEGGIRNLTIAGDATSYSSPAAGEAVALVPFVDVLDGGTLENCINRMNVNIESCAKDAVFAGFVNVARGGKVMDCVNEGSFSIVSDCSSTSRTIYGGGIVATVFELSSQLMIKDCVNKGTINMEVSFPSSNSAPGAKDVGVGGIIGRIHSGDADKYVRVSDCVNDGVLRLDCSESVSKSATYQYSLGGIVGLSASLSSSKLANPVSAGCCYLVIENCSNTAPLYNNSISRCGSGDIDGKIFTGGIAGGVFGLKDRHALIDNCTNTGAVVPYIGGYVRQAFPAVCGGLVGIGGYLDITGGKVSSVIGSTEAFSYAQAGIIGTVLTKFSISDVEVSADIQMVEADTYTNGNYALAVTSSDKIKAAWKSLAGSVIRNCRFKGSFAISKGKYSSGSLTVPAAGAAVPVTADDFRSLIVSSSYTGTDIEVSDDNTYLN